MNLPVGCYCHRTMEECKAQGYWLADMTVDFCTVNNPLFLERPEWMRMATCYSAYGFVFGYVLIGLAAAFDLWAKLRLPLTLFLGAKMYAIAMYHTMEFTSATPPPNPPLVYFSVEGPYIISIGLVLLRLHQADAGSAQASFYTDKTSYYADKGSTTRTSRSRFDGLTHNRIRIAVERSNLPTRPPPPPTRRAGIACPHNSGTHSTSPGRCTTSTHSAAS